MKLKTVGTSKKVAWPAALLALVGLGVLVVWLIDGSNRDALMAVALSAFGAAGITGGVGYAAPATPVEAVTSRERVAAIGRQDGYGLVEVGVFLLLVALAFAVVVYLLD